MRNLTTAPDTTVVTACPACTSVSSTAVRRVSIAEQNAACFPFNSELHEKLTLETTNSGGYYDLLRCEQCGLIFASPMVAPTSTWYQLAYRALEVKAEVRWEFTIVLEHLRRSDNVYEIGCGAGAFLKLCRERGIDAFGVDFSQDAIDACATQGLAAERMDIGLRARRGGQAATVVASFHVFEHLECPDDMFRAATEAADDGASLWLSVPSCRRVSSRLVLPDPLDDPPHHLTKWTEAALASVGARNGWHFEELLYEPFSWRSALWSVASVSRPYAWFRAHGWTRLPGFERALRAVLYPAAFIRLLRSPRRNELTGFAMIGRFRKVSTH